MKTRLGEIGRVFLVMGVILTAIYASNRDATPVEAQSGTGVIRVATTGSDTSGCGSVASPCRTIQYAVELANSGDTILVAGGTYSSSTACLSGTAVVCILHKSLTILGGYSTSNWSTANPSVNVTIIDGQNTRRGLRIQGTPTSPPSASLQMEGFTIQNGLAQGAASGSDDQTFAFGAGMFSENSPVTLSHMVFRNNRAIGGTTGQSYGGAGAGGGLAIAALSMPIVVLEHVTFENNQARGGNGQDRGGVALGGGWFTSSFIASGSYITFTGNVAVAGSSNGSGFSGGLYADGLGGAASVGINSDVTLQHVSATGNSATGGAAPSGNAGGAYGGAFFAEHSQFTLSDAHVRNNLAQGGNGTNASTSGGLAEGGGIQSANSGVILNRVTLVNNTARGGNGSVFKGAVGGGGVALTRFTGSSTVQIINSIIANNLADLGTTGALVGGGGGGLWLQGTTGSIIHTTIAANNVANQLLGQGAILVGGAPTPTTANFSFSIVANHTNGFGAAAVHAQQASTATLNRTLWAGNSKNTNAGEPQAGTINNTNPVNAGTAGFVAPGAPNYDYHISGTSPARSQATGSSFTVDIDNESRISFAPPDIGADEYAPINLNVIPTASGTLKLIWKTNSSLVTGLDHYNIVYSFEPGANPADQGSSPINAGTQTNYTLTGLSNHKRYTMTIEARGAANALIASSNMVTAFPTDIFVYLPTIFK